MPTLSRSAHQGGQRQRTLAELLVLVPRDGSQPSWLLKPGRWTLGSAATCAFRLSGDGVQLRHAVIMCGPRSVVLKAWDARTWCNGEPVCGEVSLRAGDWLKIGSVTLDVQGAGAEDVFSQLPEAEVVDVMPSVTVDTAIPCWVSVETSNAASVDDAEFALIENLQRQIIDLRGELADAALRRPAAEVDASTEVTESTAAQAPTFELTELQNRIAELECRSAAAQELADATTHDWNAARAEWAARESEWAEHKSDFAAREAAWSVRELEIAASEAEFAAREAEFADAQARLAADRDELLTRSTEELQAKGERLAELSTQVEELQAALDETRWATAAVQEELAKFQEVAQQRQADWELQSTEWSIERGQLFSELESRCAWAEKLLADSLAAEEAHQDAVARANSECEQLRSEVESLRKSADEAAHQLAHEVKARDAAETRANSECEQLRSEIASLRKSAADALHQLAQAVEARHAAESQSNLECEQLRSEVESLRKAAEEAARQTTQAVEVWQAAEAEANLEREQLRSAVASLRKSAEESSHQLSQAVEARLADSAQWESERGHLERELAGVTKNVERLAAELRDAHSAHRTDADHWLAEIDRLQAELSAEGTARQQHDDEIVETERRRELESQLADRQQWNEQVARFESEIAELKQQLEVVTNDRAQLKSELEEAQVQQSAVGLQLEEQLSAHADLKQQQAELADSLNEVRELQTALSEERSRWQAEQAEQAASEARVRAEIEDWKQTRQTQLTELEAARFELETAKGTWLAQCEQENAELAAARAQLEQQQQSLQDSMKQQTLPETVVERGGSERAFEEADDGWAVDLQASATKTAERSELPRFEEQDDFEARSTMDFSPASSADESPADDVEQAVAQSVESAASSESKSHRPEWASQILSDSNLSNDWSVSEPSSLSRPTDHNGWTTMNSDGLSREPASEQASGIGSEPVQDLRSKLAAMFDLPGLGQSRPVDDETDRVVSSNESDGADAVEQAGTPAESPDTDANANPELASQNEPVEAAVPAANEAAPVRQELTSLSFAADEPDEAEPEDLGDLDDSVKRYMQRLLGRQASESGDVGHLSQPARVATKSTEPPPQTVDSVDAAVASAKEVVEADTDETYSHEPVHQQDRNALRTTTDQLRQVANLQALHNVKQHGRKKMFSSFKNKIALAAFAFLVGLGFLGLGYRGSPAFIVLGGCSVCIGLLTWVDMIIAVRESRLRAAGLSKRAKQ